MTASSVLFPRLCREAKPHVLPAVVYWIAEEEVVEEIMLKPAAIKKMIEPKEIASLVCYLCSEKGRSITGASWTVDCGWTAQ